jgi:hypothetical protein
MLCRHPSTEERAADTFLRTAQPSANTRALGAPHRKVNMQPLSKQLQDLSDRAKKTEDVVAAARSKDRQRLAQQKADLRASIAAASAEASNARDKLSTWWADTRASVDDRFAARRAKGEERHLGHDLKKAQHQADEAEADAADAVACALYLLDEAEQAVIDAVSARAVADELALDA